MVNRQRSMDENNAKPCFFSCFFLPENGLKKIQWCFIGHISSNGHDLIGVNIWK